MPVQNFLEDEEYDESDDRVSSGNTANIVGGSFVPNFLDEEDYDESSVDLIDGDEDLFDGKFNFLEDDEEDFSGSSAPSYSISGLPTVTPKSKISEPPTGSVSAPVRDDPTVDDVEVTSKPLAGSVDTAVDIGQNTVRKRVDLSSRGKRDSRFDSDGSSDVTGSSSVGLPSTVPNFLEDEDDSEVTSTVVNEGQKSRRDLSRRPTNTSKTEPVTPIVSESSSSRTISESEFSESDRLKNSTDQLNVAKSNKAPAGLNKPSLSSGSSKSTKSTSSAPVIDNGALLKSDKPISFKSKAFDDESTKSKGSESLKAPSGSAAGREYKLTALRQSDSTVRKVGSDGLTNTERSRMASAKAKSSLRELSNGKLSSDELLFYANMGAYTSGSIVGKRGLLLPPVLGESLEDKRAREARINRSLPGGSIAHGAKSRLTEKDYMVLQFTALFKFVSERQIAKLLHVSEHSAYKRLNSLRKHGLTKGFKTLGVKGSVWVLTETGMDLSGFELPRGSEGSLTLSMVSHQFTINHVAANLWSGGANVLRESAFPQSNRVDGNGELALGERLVSELQIQSAFGKVRGSSKAEAFVPQIKREMAGQFDNWRRAGGVDFGPSPEFLKGNEYMWTLFPPIANRLSYHVPDLVVARPRSADGKPQSIAVEVELKTKSDDTSYEKTLDAYRMEENIYRKVVWVCRLRSTAEKLMRIAKKNGLVSQNRFVIVPIYLEDGSMFTGKDTWSL